MSDSDRGVLRPGDKVGGFVIEAIAGRGGMGVVYRAQQTKPNRLVALKVIAPDLAEQSEFRARFEREAMIAAQIEHPNVIPVYAVDEDRGVLFLAMRFVSGSDLRTLIAKHGRVEPRRAAAIIVQVGRALDAAHGHGLVHRDVKPANILLSVADGRDHVYLTDFGLTRHIEGPHGFTSTGTFLGTIDYIAPEQARAERVDARTDVYSLGCVLYHALAGTVPFPLANDLAKLYAHGTQQPPSVCELVPDVPAACDRVLARAMAKSPDERYLSAGDFGRAALAAAADLPPASGEHSIGVGDAAAPDRAATQRRLAAAERTPAQAAAKTRAAVATGRLAAGGGGAWRRPGRRAVLASAFVAAAAAVTFLLVGGSGGHSHPTIAPPAGPGPGPKGPEQFVVEGPSMAVRRAPAASAQVSGHLPKQAKVVVLCSAVGDPVVGPFYKKSFTTPVWDKVFYAAGKLRGFIPDAFVQAAAAKPVSMCEPVRRHPDAAFHGSGLGLPAVAVYTAPKLSSRILGQLPYKAPAIVVCTAIGDPVAGTAGGHPVTSPVWDGIRAHTAARNLGFIPDVFIQTGTNGLVAPLCK